MNQRNHSAIPPEELKQVGAGIAIFIGALALAALLKPLAPWARRYPDAAKRPEPPEHEEPVNEDDSC